MKRLLIIAGTTVVLAGGSTAAAYAYAGSSGSLSRTPSAPSAPPVPAVGRLLHGEAATTDGLRDWQSGTVSSVSATALTVRSSDGTTWTWTLNGSTTVGALIPFGGDGGGVTSVSAIKAGDSVMVAGSRSGSTRTADRIIDPPPDFDKIRQRLDRLGSDLKRSLTG